MNKKTIALVAVVALAALSGCIASIDSAGAESDSAAVDGLSYTADMSCQDQQVAECVADVQVQELPENVTYVEVRTVNTVSAETSVHTITVSPAHAYVTEANGTDLTYGDVAIVEAQLDNGDRVVLERHQFSCEDAAGDACNERVEQE